MATGSAISAVFCTAAPIGARPWFSQYSRPAEVPVFVRQYSVKLSSTSSFVRDCAGSLQCVHSAKPGCMSSHPMRPARESTRPYPTARGRAVSIAT
jgi:hypothetical protein